MALGFAVLSGLSAGAVELEDADREFFEKRVRPVLVASCYDCHSEETEAQGGLLLDSRTAWQQGGDSGPLIVPGDPQASRLVQAVLYDDPHLEMPPDGKLPEDQVEALVEWVRRGAPDPRQGGAAPQVYEVDIEAGRQFWSFQPPKRVEPPQVDQAEWPETDIDRWILARLEGEGLGPSGDADRRTLLRRAYFDLIGLPPTAGQIEAFLQDDSSEAFARVIDQLLASPQFGQRWGRHWLDVARYAESTGERGRLYGHAWRYRDYVIGSFNQNKPYDRFLAEQIAGDLLPYETAAERHEQLIATAFLALGPHNFELQDKPRLSMEVIDEQIATVGRGLLGLTLDCARCHHHKTDPVPTEDYYALAGIFRSTQSIAHSNVSNWIEQELPVDPQREAAVQRHAGQVKELQQRLAELKRMAGQSDSSARASGPRDPADLPGIVVDDAQAETVGSWKHSTHHPSYVGRGYIHDDRTGKGEKSITFTPDLPEAGEYEIRISYTHGSDRAPNVPVTIVHAGGEETVRVSQQGLPPIEGLLLPVGRYPFEQGRDGWVRIGNEGTQEPHVVIADAVQWVPVGQIGQPAGPQKPDAQAEQAKAKIQQVEAELKTLQQQAPERPRAMVVREQPSDQIGDQHVLVRGMVRQPGERVPRGFVTVATAATPPQIGPQQSGRLQLAQWLASPDNPLTARVMANRIWHHLFGAGLVRTTDNFGMTGQRPSHPELLDWLAVEFMEQGWSVKTLIRQIMLSRVYQQSSDGRPELAAADPENRLLGRMNRRRLEAEPIRDAMLAASGELDLTAGGRTYPQDLRNEYGYQVDTLRRAVYVPVFRVELYDFFDVFDFADPNRVAGSRSTTTLPTQALYLMNHPFVLDRAEAAARRLLEPKGLDQGQRVEVAYQWTLGRPPNSEQRELALEYLAAMQAGQPDSPQQRLQAWTDLFQALFSSIDFRYLD